MGRDFHFIYSSFKINILRLLVLAILLTLYCCDKHAQNPNEENVYLVL